MAEDECRVEYVDGVAVSARGSGPMSPEDLDAFSEVVRAAKRHVAANPPAVSERVKNLADRIERGDIITIARPGIKAAVREELRRRHPETSGSERERYPDCQKWPHLAVDCRGDWMPDDHDPATPEPIDSSNGAPS